MRDCAPRRSPPAGAGLARGIIGIFSEPLRSLLYPRGRERIIKKGAGRPPLSPGFAAPRARPSPSANLNSRAPPAAEDCPPARALLSLGGAARPRAAGIRIGPTYFSHRFESGAIRRRPRPDRPSVGRSMITPRSRADRCQGARDPLDAKCSVRRIIMQGLIVSRQCFTRMKS